MFYKRRSKKKRVNVRLNLMDKISLIVPVYNGDSCIGKCFDSIVNQTYKNIEILLINDGSIDNAGKICDEYAGKDNRIKVFHKNNGGVCSAMNVGLKHSTGDYIGFVDSDDWIESDMFENLHKVLKSANCQISVCSYFKDTDIQSDVVFNKVKIPEEIISLRNMLLYPLQRDYYMGFCSYIWNKLYSADILKNYQFDTKITHANDVLFYNTVILSEKCTGIYIDRPLYHYYQRSTSISKSESLAIKNDLLIVYKRVEDMFKAAGYSDIIFWARGFYCHHASVIAEIALRNRDKETLRRMQNEIILHLDDYIKTNKDFPEKFDRIHKLLQEECV